MSWFSEGKYDDALSLYTKAIELNPRVPVYYGNRSFCYIKTEYYGYALEDANKAIELDKKYIKVCWNVKIDPKAPIQDCQKEGTLQCLLKYT